MDADAKHIKNTRNFGEVKYPEMKVALDRACEDAFSDQRTQKVVTDPKTGKKVTVTVGLSPAERFVLNDGAIARAENYLSESEGLYSSMVKSNLAFVMPTLDNLQSIPTAFKGALGLMGAATNSDRTEGRQIIRMWADQGAYGVPGTQDVSTEIGRVCANEVNYELHGGLGVTHEADVSNALELCTSRADRLASEQAIHALHPDIEPRPVDHGSYMRAVIGDDLGGEDDYRTAKVDRVVVAWIGSGGYEQPQYLRDEDGNLILDENNQPIPDVYLRDANGQFILDKNGKPKVDDDKMADLHEIYSLTDRMVNADYCTYVVKNGEKIRTNTKIEGYRSIYNDEDYRLSIHNLTGALGNSKYITDCYEDEQGILINPAFAHFRATSAEFIRANEIKPNVKGEPPEETFIVHTSVSPNTGKMDVEHVEACNRLLYPEQPAFISAEQSVLKARDKGTVHLGASDDPAVYEELKVMLANGEVDGVKSLDDLFTHMTGGNEEMCIRAGARLILYGGVEVEPSVTEALAMHLASYANEHYDNNNDANSDDWNASDAAEDMMLFREMAMTHPEIIPNLRERIHKANFTISGSIAGMDLTYTDMKSKYLAVLNEVEGTVSNETVFLDADGNRITNPELQNEIMARNCELVNEISAEITSMGRDFALKVDQEGGFSDFANNFNEVYGIGTTRADVKTIYGQTRMMQRRLELAAQGKLRDKHGNVISLHDEAKNLQEQLQKLAESTTDYDEAQEYTKMAMVLTPIFIVTAPVATTGVATTAAVMGTSTAVFEGGSMLWEHETATVKKGTRGEVLTDAAIRTAEDAALGAAIPGVGKLAKGIAKGVAKGTKYVKKVARARRINNIRANRLHSMPAPAEHVNLHGTRMNPEGVHINAARNAYVTPESNTINISDLEVQLNEAEISNTLRQNYDDFLRNDVMDRSKVREMIIKTHSDRGGSDELFRAVDELNQAIKEGNIARARNAKDNLRTLLEQKSAKLDTYREQMKVYREAQATGTAPHTEPTVAPHTEPTAAPHTEPTAAPHTEPTAAPHTEPPAAPHAETPAPRRPYSEPTIREVPIENNQILHADAPAPTAKPVEAPRVETPVVKPNSVESEVRVLPEGFKKAKTPEEAQAIYDELIKARKGDVDEYIEGNAKFFDSQDGWVRSWTQTHHETKWKMHIYANSPEEWSDAAQLSIPYLLEHNIDFKTVKNLDEHFKLLSTTSNGTQKGKAFTIYFRNEEEFLRTAEDLEGIFNQSGLRSSGKVTGEGQIGNSGFLSYRNSLGKRGTLAPEGMPDPWAQHVATRSSVKPSTTPVIEPVMVEPAGKVNYNQKILKLNNPDEIQSLRAEINASEQLSKKEKKILNDILNEKETALRARQLKPDTNVSFFDDEVRIVDDEVRIVDDEVRIVDDEVQIVSANNDVIIRPEVKLGNDPVVVDFNDRIRIGGAVDIDVRSLKPNFDAMAEGEEFFIGRSVNGPNDVLINNEFVSGKHLRVKKVNGQIQITDMSKNGTVLNTVEPDIATYSAERAERFRNATTNDYKNMLDENYNELRRGTYSHESSISHNTTEADLKIGVNDETEYWYWHRPQGSVDVIAVQDRISLNVVADKNLMAELDLLISEGRYGNPPKFIEVPKCNYKTPKTFDRWTHRHDPITMYFEGPVSPELEQAISEITEKYARQSVNGRSLMNALEGKPWIAHEANVKAEDAVQLWQDAEKLDSDLAKAIYNDFTHNGEPILMDPNDPYSWNVSAGSYNSAKKLINEYKLYHPEKNARILKPEIPSQAVTPEVSMPDPLDPSNPLNFGNGIIGQAEAAAEEEVNSGLFGGFFKFLGF